MSSKSVDVATMIAVATFALCLVIITGVLGAIAIRDGSNPLVSQSMQELVAIGGASILALGAVAGLKKYLETKSDVASQQQQQSNAAGAASSDPAGFSASPLGIAASDVAAILAAAGAQVAPVATATAAPDAPVAPAATAGA